MKLWLDDIRNPDELGFVGFTWVKNVEEAIALLKTGQVEFASLDHDLRVDRFPVDGSRPNWPDDSGYDVVCWIEANNVWPPEGCVVHSTNIGGRLRMEAVVKRHYAICRVSHPIQHGFSPASAEDPPAPSPQPEQPT